IKNLWDIVPAEVGDRFLSMLPPWHAYERACEYFIFTHGVEQVYTTVRNLKDDLQRYQPHYIISVPLVYETLYRYVLFLGIILILVHHHSNILYIHQVMHGWWKLLALCVISIHKTES
ncbi:putative acyl-activating enzyme 16, partial [Quercus suber]